MTHASSISEQATSGVHHPIEKIHVGLIGLGTVGTGVYKLLSGHANIVIDTIAVRDSSKKRDVEGLASTQITENPFQVVRHPDTHVVIEVMGGVEPALELIKEALRNKKHVVTANKELIARFGPELFVLAQENNVRILFEGAVAGGIPIIMPLKLSLAANDIQEIAGILNGTTNYILTKMSQDGLDYETALKQAQELGFAEADPTNDVEGFDSAYKIGILSSIAFKKRVDPAKIYRKGITNITAVDIENARSLGFAIKLIGFAQPAQDADTHQTALDIRVHPMLIPLDHPLASIHNEYNAVWVKGNAVGSVMFYGRGAGELPTASAVCGDVLAITNDLSQGNDPIPAMAMGCYEEAPLLPITETRNRYYIRLNTNDVPGVIGNLGNACGDSGVSLESVMQRGAIADGTASIVLVTHEVYEKQMRSALDRIVNQESTRSIGCTLRVL
jgi:homoserine dehydrogenase